MRAAAREGQAKPDTKKSVEAVVGEQAKTAARKRAKVARDTGKAV